MRILIAAMVTVALSVSAHAADGSYALTGENTKVEFTGTKKDGKHEGGFKTGHDHVGEHDGISAPANVKRRRSTHPDEKGHGLSLHHRLRLG